MMFCCNKNVHFLPLLDNVSLKMNSITSCDAFESQLEIVNGF